MKKIIIICLLGSLTTHLFSQGVGVGTLTPNQSAVLDLTSTTKGVLIPRMTTAQRDAIVSPAAGLQILNTDDYCLDIYDGTGWIKNCGLRVIGTDTAATSLDSIANFAGIARSWAVAFTVAGKGYVGTGYDGANRKKDFWQYDPATNVWTQKADFGGTARYAAVGLSINGKGYIGTGWDGGSRDDFWMYDPYPNTWTQKSDVPGSFIGRTEAIAISFDQYSGFVGLGRQSESDEGYSDMYEYIASADNWVARTNCPVPVWSSVAFKINQMCYVGTGIFEFGFLDWHIKTFWSFNPAGSGTWTQLADFPGSGRGNAVGFSVGNRGYIGTGKNVDDGLENDLWEYTPIANTWKIMPEIGENGRKNAVVFTIGGVAYIGTGYDGAYKADFMAFEPYPQGPVYETTLDANSAGGLDDGIWKKESDQVSTSHRINITSAQRTLTHPDNRPFYFTGDLGYSSNGVEFCRSDGRQGIGIGWGYLYPAGTDAALDLGLAAKGASGGIKFSTAGLERMKITSQGQVHIGYNSSANQKIVFSEIVNNGHQFAGFGNSGGSLRYQVDATTSDHIFYAGASASSSNELMRLKGNGNLGLNIAAPQNKLDINSGVVRTGTHATSRPLYITGALSDASNGVEIRKEDATQGIGFGFNTMYAAGSDANQNLGMSAKGATGSLLFSTNGTEKVRIAATGEMGIGDISPQNKLDIESGAARTGTHSTGRPLYVTGTLSDASNGVEIRHADGTQGIGFGKNTIYAAGSNADQNLGMAAKGTAGHLIFTTNAIERARITANGNLGIGTTSPNAPLQFASIDAKRKIVLFENSNNDNEFHGFGIDNDGTLRYQIGTTGNDHAFFAGTSPSASNELMRIKGNGNIGIGITGPQNKLDINNGVTRTGTHATGRPLYVTGNLSDASNGVEIRHTDGTQGIGIGRNTIYAAGTNADHNLGLAAKGAAGNLNFSTNGLERVKIAGDGKVGIGIASPQNKLDINGGGTRTGTHPTGLPMYVSGIVGAASGGVEFRHDNGTQGIGIGYNTIYTSGSNTDQVLGLAAKGATGHLIFSTNGVERVRITGGGDIGIGTTTPNAPLQFATSVENRKIVMYEVNNNDHQYHGFGINDDGSLRYQTSTTANDHAFFAATSSTNSLELLRIKGNGNLQVTGVIETDGFTVPTLLNNFTNYGNGHAGVAYYKDKMGRVFLRGLVNNVNNPTNLVVFTLPVGYRPSTSGRLVFTSISNNALGRVDVLANGDVMVTLGTAGWISLDNISFKAD